MKRLRRIGIIALSIVAQLYLVILLTLRPVNLARIPYRRAERVAAERALARDQSPENRAAVQKEIALASHYTSKRQFAEAGIIFVMLLIFEAFVIYRVRNGDRKYR
jgi:hypothetical protein